MVKLKTIVIFTFSFVFLFSYAQTRRLEDGTKVLTKKYKNINKFDKSIYKDISIDYFYENIDCYTCDKNFNKIRDYSKFDTNIQFYDTGHLRVLGMPDANPENTGWRGIIYLKNNRIRIDMQESTQGGGVFRGTYKVKIDGDKIYLLRIPNILARLLLGIPEYDCYIYQKSEKIPEDWKDYKADW